MISCFKLKIQIARLDENLFSHVNNGNEEYTIEVNVDDSGDVVENALDGMPHAQVDPRNGEQISISERNMSSQYLSVNLFSAALDSCGVVKLDEENDLQLDDIKIEYHHSSKRKPIITHFQDFTRARATLDIPPDEEPYRPFYCCKTLNLCG